MSEQECVCMHREGEGERERESPGDSALSTEPNKGLDLTTVRS